MQARYLPSSNTQLAIFLRGSRSGGRIVPIARFWGNSYPVGPFEPIETQDNDETGGG